MATLLTQPGKPDHYLFVIDTNRSAGNFERYLCAYITGQIAKCNHGKENAALAKKEIPKAVAELEELVEHVPDEHGVDRPVTVFQDKNDRPNSVAIYLNSIPRKGLLKLMKERAYEITSRGVGIPGYEEKVEINGFRLLEQRTTFQELPI